MDETITKTPVASPEHEALPALDGDTLQALWRAIHALEDRAFGHGWRILQCSDILQPALAAGLQVEAGQDHDAAERLRRYSEAHHPG